MERQVEKFAAIDPETWRMLAMRASWYYRSEGVRPMPPVILAAFGGRLPDYDGWKKVCRAVGKARRKAKYDERKYVRDQAREKRRQYMRKYMRDRRASV